MQKDDFRNFAVNHLGMSSNTLDSYARYIDKKAGGMVTAPTADYMNPYILEERQLNVTQMDVFSRLMMDRIIFLGTQVTDQSSNIIEAQMLYLDSVDPEKDISLYINSPGGSVYAGLGIYDTMQYISSDVSTICTGMAASMAAVLLVAGEKGKRYALPHSRVMIHQPMGGIQGQASDIEITAREILLFQAEDLSRYFFACFLTVRHEQSRCKDCCKSECEMQQSRRGAASMIHIYYISYLFTPLFTPP